MPAKLRIDLVLIALLLLAALSPLPATAAGGAPAPPPPPTMTPAEEAAQLYNEGLRLRDKAWSLEEKAEEKAEETPNETQQARLDAKVQKQFEKAIKKFERATELNPRLFQAFSSLGYALRRTGQYERALTAYNRALALNPNYTEAVEYRAEAYLGLDRVAEAKTAYMFLFNRDKKRAGELLEAMEEWVEARREDPRKLPQDTVEGFATWVAERAGLATTTQQASTGGSW